MKLNTTSERDLEIVVDDQLNYIIAIEQLVVISEKFGFDKGFENLVVPLISMFQDETDDEEIDEIKQLLGDFLENVSSLEKWYYIHKNKDFMGI